MCAHPTPCMYLHAYELYQAEAWLKLREVSATATQAMGRKRFERHYVETCAAAYKSNSNNRIYFANVPTSELPPVVALPGPVFGIRSLFDTSTKKQTYVSLATLRFHGDSLPVYFRPCVGKIVYNPFTTDTTYSGNNCDIPLFEISVFRYTVEDGTFELLCSLDDIQLVAQSSATEFLISKTEARAAKQEANGTNMTTRTGLRSGLRDRSHHTQTLVRDSNSHKRVGMYGCMITEWSQKKHTHMHICIHVCRGRHSLESPLLTWMLGFATRGGTT